METVRDLLLDIGIQADTSPIAETQRRLRDLQRQIGGYERTQTRANTQIVRSNQRLIDETQVVNREFGRQSDVIRQLARTAGGSAQHMSDSWNSMSTEMRRSLVQNHNNLGKYRRDLMAVEGDVFKLSTEMGHYTGSTDDYMKQIRKLGKDHKKISDQMINSNLAMRQGFVQQIATMSAMSGQSDKIIKNYDRMGNVVLSVNKPFLGITSGMERMAREANAANMALQMLGPNASMKDLVDQIALINQGVMRQQMVIMFAAAAWIAFTAVVANAALGPDPEKVRAEQDLITKIYTDALSDRISEIKMFASIFQDVATPKIDPNQLTKNLQEQVVIIRNWSSNLKTLAGRGVSDAMMAELQKMGPSAASEIQAMTQMTQPQLDQYVKDFHQRYKLITKQATSELVNLKKETDKQIKELQDSLTPLGVSWEKFKGTWTNAAAPFVELWGHIAATIVNVGARVGEFIQRLNEINPWITKLGGMFLYLVSTFVLLLSPLAAGIGWIMGLQAAFSAAWMVIGPLITGLGAMMGTVLLVSGVVLGLGVAFYLLWTRSDKFKEGIINGWNAIKTSAVSVWGSMKPLIMQALDAIATFGKQKLDQLRAFWDENGAQILQAGKNVWTVISTVISTVLGVIWKAMKFVWPAILAIIKSVWANINGVINGALLVITGVVKFFAALFTGDFHGMWEAIKQIFRGAVMFVWNYIQLTFFGKILGAGKAFVLTFRSVIVGMWTGIRTGFVSGINFIKNIFISGWNFLRGTSQKIVNGMTSHITNRFFGMLSQARTIFNLLRQFGETIFRALWNTIRSVVGNIVANVRTGFTTMKNRATILADNMKTAVTDRFTAIVDAAKLLPGKIGAGIKGMAKHALGGIKHLANSLVSGLASGVNGVGDGINWVFEKVGVKDANIPKWNPPKYANGTNGHGHPGGLAWVGDGGGAELIRTPSGQIGLSPSTATLVNLPRGTEVLPHRETQMLMNTPRYATGAGQDTKGGLWDAVKDVTGSAVSAVKDTAGNLKNLTFDVFSMMGDPAGLMAKVWDKIGAVFPKMDGAFGKVGSGAFGMIKDKALDFVSSKLSSVFMAGGYVGGEDKDPFTPGRGAGFGGMMRYVEYWYNQVKDRFGPTHFMGGYANRANTADTSQLSMHAYGRAFDIGGSHSTMSAIAEFMRKVKDIENVIYNRRISSSGGSWRKYTGPNPHTDHVHADFKGVQMPAEQAHGGAIPNVTGGAAAWRPAIIQAAQRMNEAVTPAQVQGIIAQIDRESKGNQRIFQSPAVNDINMRNGTPARGLLQYIPSTFKNYMVKGHMNILSGVDQLLAFFNNTNWRRDLPYGKRGWGPTGARKYANGGIVTKAHMGLVGEAGPEAIIPLSPARRSRGLNLLSTAASAMGVSVSSPSDEAYNPQPSSNVSTKNVQVTFAPEITVTVQGGGADTSQQEAPMRELIRKLMQEQWDGNFMRLLAQFGLTEEGV
ncbi:hypothetical protein AWH48_11575 [Domibacillus aminovorans]|uniref:Transglycosylase SLT domain-containing protein n=1 Tax=Domibacillus aminovorans TaxID=29332 RepID=A0A177KMV6_9BACI|nr:hypothetical protein [Domibacillus aminovorans]OAH53901.1 hypothetical protein AWH48_11575 [Domibacillus aminovorans]